VAGIQLHDYDGVTPDLFLRFFEGCCDCEPDAFPEGAPLRFAPDDDDSATGPEPGPPGVGKPVGSVERERKCEAGSRSHSSRGTAPSARKTSIDRDITGDAIELSTGRGWRGCPMWWSAGKRGERAQCQLAQQLSIEPRRPMTATTPHTTPDSHLLSLEALASLPHAIPPA
jgi:hypothetical protein